MKKSEKIKEIEKELTHLKEEQKRKSLTSNCVYFEKLYKETESGGAFDNWVGYFSKKESLNQLADFYRVILEYAEKHKLYVEKMSGCGGPPFHYLLVKHGDHRLCIGYIEECGDPDNGYDFTPADFCANHTDEEGYYIDMDDVVADKEPTVKYKQVIIPNYSPRMSGVYPTTPTLPYLAMDGTRFATTEEVMEYNCSLMNSTLSRKH